MLEFVHDPQSRRKAKGLCVFKVHRIGHPTDLRRRNKKEKQGQALRFDWPRNAFISWVLRARAIRLA
jgi:hypothetical protein